MVMVNQGVHADNFPFTSGGNGSSDGNFLGAAGLGFGPDSVTPAPFVSVQCPPSGTFDIVWAPFDRFDGELAHLPPDITFSATSATASPISYPANELDIFKRSNREGYFAGNMFSNINPALYTCEVRVNQPVTGSNVNSSGAQLCDPNVSATCTPCARGVINFAVLTDGTQVPASDVSTANFQSGSVLGGAQDYWSSRAVTFNSTGLLSEVAIPGGDGASTSPDGWCPNGGFVCSGNNVVVINSPGPDTTGTPTLDTLQIHFAQPQPSATIDIDNGYLGESPQTTVQLSSGGVILDTLTLVESCPAGGCPAGTIPEIAACPQSQNSLQLCGRFQLSDPLGKAFDEIDVLPTTLAGASPACTITTSGHAGNPGPGGKGSNYDANCGGSLIDNLAFGGFGPGSNTVVFPDAHNWFEPTFGTNHYVAERSCSSDRSSCIANYEGSISTGTACANLSLDVDTADPVSRSYAGSARALYDVGGCFFNNNGAGVPTTARFNDGLLYDPPLVSATYPAYGVTSFFANYGTGVDGFGVSCTGNQAPTATAAACSGGSCSSSITVSEQDSVTLDGTGSADPDGDPLAFAWSESANAVTPSVSSNPQYTFAVPVGSAGHTLTFNLTASDPCYLVAGSVVNVHVKPNTTTTLTSSVNPSAAGQPVTFTATVSCAGSCSGAPTPTGLVQFSDGPTVLGIRILDNTGKVTLTTTSELGLGTHNIIARYGGDGNFNVSMGTLLQKISLDPTTTTVTFSPTPNAILGQSVTITATVTTSGFGTPNGGTVTFFDGSTQLGSPVTLSSSGVATLTTSTLTIGLHTIKASYSGDTTTFASSSGTATLNVTYKVVAEYNQTTGSKSGTTIAIKVQLQNFAGKNLSSSSITLTLISNPVSPSPAPGAQPSGTFTFMSKSDTGPGYQYNLKTTNFPKNTYSLSFTATGDPVVHKVGFVIN